MDTPKIEVTFKHEDGTPYTLPTEHIVHKLLTDPDVIFTFSPYHLFTVMVQGKDGFGNPLIKELIIAGPDNMVWEFGEIDKDKIVLALKIFKYVSELQKDINNIETSKGFNTLPPHIRRWSERN